MRLTYSLAAGAGVICGAMKQGTYDSGGAA